jgi:CheY-like chemotaxis protein
MDIQMPEMDGIEAARRIRAAEPPKGRQTPIVALTAHAMKSDHEACKAAGMETYITKPIGKDDLCTVLETVALRSCSPTEVRTETESKPETARLIHPRRLLSMVGGETTLVSELHRIFKENHPAAVRRIREGIDENDAAKVQFAAHGLKGMCLNITADAAASLSLELEKNGRAGDLTGAAQILDRLAKTLEETDAALESFIASGPDTSG